MHNARTPRGRKLTYLRDKEEVYILCDNYNYCMRFIRTPNFRTEHANNVEHPRTLLDVRYGVYSIEAFSMSDIDTIILGSGN